MATDLLKRHKGGSIYGYIDEPGTPSFIGKKDDYLCVALVLFKTKSLMEEAIHRIQVFRQQKNYELIQVADYIVSTGAKELRGRKVPNIWQQIKQKELIL